MNQRTTFRRLTVIVSLMVACIGLAILAPGRAQEGIPGDPFTIVVPAGDSMGLALALIRAGTVGGTVVLQNSTYRFNYPGSAETPQFPHLRGTVILEGNGATLEFSGTTADADLSTIFILENSRAEFRHVNLVVTLGKGRLVSNRGTLVINDSTLLNAQAGEGGGIENFGNLTLNRTILSRHRILSASTPGGAIWNSGTLTASCAQFRENRASQGGAVWNEQQGQVTISHSAFTGNQANGGGAIFNAGSLALNASENYWGGGAPVVNELTAGVDTISEQVIVSGVLERDPTLDDPLCKPTLSTVEAGSRPLSVFEANSFVPLPLSAPVRVLAANSGALLTLYPDREPLSEVGDDPALLDTPLPSPDGHNILYTSYKSGNSEVYVRDLSTGIETNLSNSPATWEGNYVWSPDSNWIAFNRQAGDYSQSSLGIVKTDGSFSWVQGTVPDPQYAPYPPSFPVWAADSQSLYFTQLYRIYQVGAAGGTPQALLQMPPLVENPLGTSHFNQIFALRGQTLLYKSYCYSITSHCLGVIHLDGGGMRLVSILTASNESPQPSYSLDSSQVVVRDGSSLYAVRVSDFGTGTRSLIATGIAGRGVWQPAQVQTTPTPISGPALLYVSTDPQIQQSGLRVRDNANSGAAAIGTLQSCQAISFLGSIVPEDQANGNIYHWYQISFQGTPAWAAGWVRLPAGDSTYLLPDLPPGCATLTPSPTQTPTSTPSLPPPICQLMVLPQFGSPTPTGTLTLTPTGTPAGDRRAVYDSAAQAASDAVEGIIAYASPGDILNVYSRSPQSSLVMYVQFISHGRHYSGWIRTEYGLQEVNNTHCGDVPNASPTPMPPPDPTCKVILTSEPRYLFSTPDQALQESQRPEPNLGTLEADDELWVYNRYNYGRHRNIIWVHAPSLNQAGWFNSSFGLSVVDDPRYENCDALLTMISTFTPTPVGFIPSPTPMPLTLPCDSINLTTFPNGVTLTGPVDCKYLTAILPRITYPEDRDAFSEILTLIQSGTDKALLIQKVEEYFKVDIQEEGKAFTYQGIVNITLGLTQTSYAFAKFDPYKRSLRHAAQTIFNGLILRRVDGGSGEGAETSKAPNGPIHFYNLPEDHTPRNVVHEIGHFVECKLKSFGCGGIEDNPQSIYGQIKLKQLVTPDGELISNFRDALHASTPIRWWRGTEGWGTDKGWQQNPSYGTSDDPANCGDNIPSVYSPQLPSGDRDNLAACMGYEESADMFLNWVYDTVSGEVFQNPKSGEGRRLFMNNVMQNAVISIIP